MAMLHPVTPPPWRVNATATAANRKRLDARGGGHEPSPPDGVSLPRTLLGREVQVSPAGTCGGAAWVFRPAAAGPLGAYVLRDPRAAHRVLSAVADPADDAETLDTELVALDDGSGRQRWVLGRTDGGRYTLRCARLGMYLRHDMRLVHGAGPRTLWTLNIGGTCRAKMPPPEPPPGVGAEAEAARAAAPLAEAAAALGLADAAQADVVARLLVVHDLGHARWWDAYDVVRSDAAGMFVGPFGAASSNGDLLDALEAVRAADPAHPLAAFAEPAALVRGGDTRGLEALPAALRASDPAWRDALWRVSVAGQWAFAGRFASRAGEAAGRPGPVLTGAAARGAVLDAVVQHGASMRAMARVLARMPAAAHAVGDEAAWIDAFLRARRALLREGFAGLDPARTGARAEAWAAVCAASPDLRGPLSVDVFGRRVAIA